MALHESYTRLGRRWRRTRGFRLSPRNRFIVRRLRAKLVALFGHVGRYVRLLMGGLSDGCPRSSSRRVLVAGKDCGHRQCQPAPPAKGRMASYMRSNSFYAQAIAECLEFIKRNSVPVEDYGSVSARRQMDVSC